MGEPSAPCPNCNDEGWTAEHWAGCDGSCLDGNCPEQVQCEVCWDARRAVNTETPQAASEGSDTSPTAQGFQQAVEAALRTDVYADGERFFEMRDEDFDAWMKRGTNPGKVAPWAQDIDRLLRQVRGVRAALRDHQEATRGTK